MPSKADKYNVRVQYDENGQAFYACVVEVRDDNGVLINPPITYINGTPEFDALFGEMGNCCDPYIASFTADQLDAGAVTPEAFHSLMITKPPCCTITIATSAGTFDLGPKDPPYSVCFDCLVTLDSIIGDCDLAKVKVILQRSC